MKQLLIVDDEPAGRAALSLILRQEGYCVQAAPDGSEALALLQRRRIDLILADVAMPGLNGYQLCRRVKSAGDPAWALIPFIFVSARSLPSDIRYGKLLGADDYLTKPVAPDELLAVVKGKLWAAERLHTAFRQPGDGPAEPPEPVLCLTFGRRHLRLDGRRQEAWLDGVALELTVKELRLLTCLARRPGWVISDVELLKATHQLKRASKQQARRKAIRAIVAYLRRKLAPHLDGANCIKTVRGRGYMLCLTPEPAGDVLPG